MNKRMTWAAIALMMATTALTACSSNDGDNTDEVISNEDNDRTDIALTRSEEQLVSGSNAFALDLMRQLVQQNPGQSMVVSPISITYALGMVNNGAAGETQQQISQALGFGDTGFDGVNDFCRKMLTEAPRLDKLTRVSIANTIYVNSGQGYELRSDFVAKARQYYDAEPEARNFADGNTLDVINRWAADHTEHMIEQILTPDEFDDRAVSYLLNAIYFKGAWAEKFSKGDTREEPFAGAAAPVPMMHHEHTFGYGGFDNMQVLNLPYGNGAYCMTVLLPNEDTPLADVLASLTTGQWERCRYAGSAIVDVKLPRFETKTDTQDWLPTAMARLGMTDAFDSERADFSGFANVPTCIGLLKQAARIKVNEEGTEAAAVTVTGMMNTAYSEPQHVTFHANRPFLYVISELSTGAIFFVGTYYGD